MIGAAVETEDIMVPLLMGTTGVMMPLAKVQCKEESWIYSVARATLLHHHRLDVGPRIFA